MDDYIYGSLEVSTHSRLKAAGNEMINRLAV